MPDIPTENRPMWRPKGIWGALMLPIDERGRIDSVALADQVDILCATRVAGVYCNGTAGEFHNQTEDEFDLVAESLASGCKKAGKPFQVGVSNSNPRVALHRLKRVRDLQPNGVQITLPDWWPPAAIERDTFVAGMSEAAPDTSLILYNPPHAKVKLVIDDFVRLRTRAANLVGVKVLGGDENWYAERREKLPEFSVFVAGNRVAFGRPKGADGSYSNVACLSPNGAVDYWDLIETDPEAALALEARFISFLQTYLVPLAREQGLSDAALDKLMAAAGGWGGISPRLLWPYSGANDATVKHIAQTARNELPELFEEHNN